MQNYTAGPSSTLNLKSLRVTVPEIWPGQDRGGKKRKKKKKNELCESHIASPTGIANNNNNNETGSRSPFMRPRSDPPNFGQIECGEKQTNNID